MDKKIIYFYITKFNGICWPKLKHRYVDLMVAKLDERNQQFHHVKSISWTQIFITCASWPIEEKTTH